HAHTTLALTYNGWMPAFIDSPLRKIREPVYKIYRRNDQTPCDRCHLAKRPPARYTPWYEDPKAAAGLYPHRVDDRGGDHRDTGRHRHPQIRPAHAQIPGG